MNHAGAPLRVVVSDRGGLCRIPRFPARPAGALVRAASHPRWQARWRPLEGPLSARSCSYALSVLGNLFGFLVGQGYLVGNPWRALSRCPGAYREGLTWAAASRQPSGPTYETSFRLPPGMPSQRLQVALLLLHDTGLRLGELVAATATSCRGKAWRSRPGRPWKDGGC